MPANLSKKSIVKHRTQTPYHPAQRRNAKGDASGTGANSTALGEARVKGQGRSGFQVGPKHAPDGAYLGRAKKIKADLIEKAKIKKHFYKKVKVDENGRGENSQGAIEARDEGKFAPEMAKDQANSSDILHQMRDRDEGRAKVAAFNGKVDARQGAVKKARKGDKAADATLDKKAKRPEVTLTKEERVKIREKKSEKYHSQSGSQRGRERGQPNLGARMDLLLEKIKKG